MKARGIFHKKRRRGELWSVRDNWRVFHYTIVIKAKNGYLVSRGGRRKKLYKLYEVLVRRALPYFQYLDDEGRISLIFSQLMLVKLRRGVRGDKGWR